MRTKRPNPAKDPANETDRASAEIDAQIASMARYAQWLDASVGIPGTKWRMGADSILGLVPVLGDWVGVGLSSSIVWRGWKLGVQRRTLARMLFYLGLEGTVGLVPVLGDLFDIWFRANLRNIDLIVNDLERHKPESSNET